MKNDSKSGRPITAQGRLAEPLPALNDSEGSRLPQGLPPVIDAHVHFFPDSLFASVWQWFDRYGWPVRYKLACEQLASFLIERGVTRIVGLHYAHKPGVARKLNRFMADLCRRHERICGLATVFPGEPDAAGILTEGFERGLGGVKLHSHVQCFDMQSTAMEEIYRICVRHAKPLIMHVGREPKSPAYPCDPYELCRADILADVIRSYPDLRVCVPHLGADEFESYQRLIEKYDNLWLDTTMMLAEYFPGIDVPDLRCMRSDRIMYGSDFPNIPYAWDRELKRLTRIGLAGGSLASILGNNAVQFYGLADLQAVG